MSTTVLKTLKVYKPRLARLVQETHKARLAAMGTSDEALWNQVNADVQALEAVIENQHKLMMGSAQVEE